MSPLSEMETPYNPFFFLIVFDSRAKLFPIHQYFIVSPFAFLLKHTFRQIWSVQTNLCSNSQKTSKGFTQTLDDSNKYKAGPSVRVNNRNNYTTTFGERARRLWITDTYSCKAKLLAGSSHGALLSHFQQLHSSCGNLPLGALFSFPTAPVFEGNSSVVVRGAAVALVDVVMEEEVTWILKQGTD